MLTILELKENNEIFKILYIYIGREREWFVSSTACYYMVDTLEISNMDHWYKYDYLSGSLLCFINHKVKTNENSLTKRQGYVAPPFTAKMKIINTIIIIIIGKTSL